LSALGDAFTALKNTMLLQERIESLRGDMSRNADDLRTLTEKVLTLDKRVVRIETMIEMITARGSLPPRIEGN
jgi:predicted nuclease with TOPRIM domain